MVLLSIYPILNSNNSFTSLFLKSKSSPQPYITRGCSKSPSKTKNSIWKSEYRRYSIAGGHVRSISVPGRVNRGARYLGQGKIFTGKFRRGWRGFMNNFGPQETRQPSARRPRRSVLITATAELVCTPGDRSLGSVSDYPPSGFPTPAQFPQSPHPFHIRSEMLERCLRSSPPTPSSPSAISTRRPTTTAAPR